MTTKSVSFKNIVTELLWFLRGGEPLNIKYLVDNKCNIWNDDTYKFYKTTNQFKVDQFSQNQFLEWLGTKCDNYTYGDCPLGYELWRNFNGVDQISELINGLKNNPESRRHMLTALNPAHYNDLALFPCHVVAQFNARPLTYKQRCDYLKNNTNYPDYVKEGELIDECGNIPKYYLDCQLYQRSCDVFLGVPYNTASYALLTHILSEITGMIAGDFIHTFGDVHIYENHMEQVDEQLKRIPSELPKLRIRNSFKSFDYDQIINNFDKIDICDFSLENYNPQPSIKAKLSTGLK